VALQRGPGGAFRTAVRGVAELRVLVPVLVLVIGRWSSVPVTFSHLESGPSSNRARVADPGSRASTDPEIAYDDERAYAVGA